LAGGIKLITFIFSYSMCSSIVIILIASMACYKCNLSWTNEHITIFLKSVDHCAEKGLFMLNIWEVPGFQMHNMQIALMLTVNLATHSLLNCAVLCTIEEVMVMHLKSLIQHLQMTLAQKASTSLISTCYVWYQHILFILYWGLILPHLLGVSPA
jgi:hypothetical protein